MKTAINLVPLMPNEEGEQKLVGANILVANCHFLVEVQVVFFGLRKTLETSIFYLFLFHRVSRPVT